MPSGLFGYVLGRCPGVTALVLDSFVRIARCLATTTTIGVSRRLRLTLMAHTGGSVGGDPLAMESKPDQILMGQGNYFHVFHAATVHG